MGGKRSQSKAGVSRFGEAVGVGWGGDQSVCGAVKRRAERGGQSIRCPDKRKPPESVFVYSLHT